MKQYPKIYEDLYSGSKKGKRGDKITSTFGSPEILGRKFIDFYKEVHMQLFTMIIKQVWLEQQFMYGEDRREKRGKNGFTHDWAFSYFIKTHVGINQKSVSHNSVFISTSTYLKDFFPDFLKHDPFKEPEYYKWPYKNITLDHLDMVYQVVDMRLDMLQYADEQKMNYTDFSNWVINHLFSYNDEIGEDVYELTMGENAWPHIRNKKIKRGWSDEKFKFEQ